MHTFIQTFKKNLTEIYFTDQESDHTYPPAEMLNTTLYYFHCYCHMSINNVPIDSLL